MTRINCVPPQELTDNHLIGEIKEINQLAGHFRKSIQLSSPPIIPPQFTLNTGHVKFFYDKGLYLHKRFNSLKEEAFKRNFNIKAEFNNEWIKYPQYYGDWIPKERDFKIIRERIKEKIQMKPHIYRFYGEYIHK